MSMTWFALPPPVELGEGWSLRFLTAAEMLECRGEGEAMAQEERDKALWANAALLSRTLWKEGSPAFETGTEVLENLTVGQIEALTRRWWAQDSFDRQPSREALIQQEALVRQEGSENERFDMARFLELGGTAGELSQDPVWEAITPGRVSAVPGLWPRSSLPMGDMPEVKRTYKEPYTLSGGAVPLRSGPAEEMESPDFPSGGRVGEEPLLAETHRIVQIPEPETAVRESSGLTVGELDRAVERDARRYGGGFSLL